MNLPTDVRPGWVDVVRRLQNIGRKQDGFTKITIEVIVDASGNPILWLEPTAQNIEPRDRTSNLLAAMVSHLR